MRAETFEIRWHETQPIYSCSFQPITAQHLRRVLEHNRAQAAGLEPGKVLNDGEGAAGPSKASPLGVGTSSRQAVIPLSAQGQSWRFATAGGDNHARIWLVHPNIPSPAALAAAASASGAGTTAVAKHPPRVEYRATLRRHSGVVNCVRFNPKEELLATTGDDGMVLFWIPSDGPNLSFGSNFDDDNDAEFAKEHWKVRTMARASSSEVYDMAWSPSGDALVIGGTDFVARIVGSDGTVIREISEHNHYIQGVAWDPLGEYIATQSSDRSVHVHHLLSKAGQLDAIQMASRNSKMDLTHRRNPSSGGQFVWDHMAKPSMKRRASSHASDSDRERDSAPNRPNLTSKRSHRSSTPLDTAAAQATTTSTPTAPLQAPSSQAPTSATPVQLQSPAPTHQQQHSMNPPQRTPSRRSSFSGSQMGSPPTSATSLAPSHPPSVVAGHASTGAGVSLPATGTPVKAIAGERQGSVSRSVSRNRAFTPRSPSPAPPLPAIRAPPSPKQRMAALQASNSGAMARLGMRLYGDESFSGFFRRLNFSPDGALLVTPTGVFETTNAPMASGLPSAANNMMQSPASPTVATVGREGISPSSPLISTGQAQAREPPARNTVYLYARSNLHRSNAPIAHLPGHKTATLVVKFSPILYELRKLGTAGRQAPDDDGIAPHPTVPLEAGKQKTVALFSAASVAGGHASSEAVSADGVSHASDSETGDGVAKQSSESPSTKKKKDTSTTASMIGLPYRMIFAVATHDSVWIYDTQQGGPLCCFSNMHYASFTDLTWSPDGQTLMMCSTDGYCSIVVFDYGELGTPYAYASQPSLQQAPAATTVLKMSGSPMMRRASAQSLPAGHGQQATPPSMLSHSFAGSGGAHAAATDLSPSMGLGLVSETDNGGVTTGNGGLNVKAALREIDPPVVPVHTPPSAALPASTGTIEASAPSSDGQAQQQQQRKKRRIVPTLEGPIGS